MDQHGNEQEPSGKVIVVNGANLSRLGSRQPDVYGCQDFNTLSQYCRQWAESLQLQVRVLQSDDEAQLVAWMHEAIDIPSAVVLNPAAFTHYSYALADACHMVTDAGLPLIEVHISNPAARETFRKHSVISPVATSTITGMGLYGYKLALEAVAHRFNSAVSVPPAQ